jgi:alcohol dehydrogenase
MQGFSYEFGTRIEFGNGASEKVGEEARGLGGSRALVVTDPGVKTAGLVEPIIASLSAAGLGVVVFDDVAPNPRERSSAAGAELAKAEGCDVLVGMGGGSPIDTAKGIGILQTYGGVIQDWEGLGTVPGPITPLIAIPTTAGTGTEVTCWAVITDSERHYKMSVGCPPLFPRVALVDPELTHGLPANLTASTGMDALTHSIEAYTATLSEPVGDAYALMSIELVAGSLRQAVASGSNAQARWNMMLASMLGGLALGGADIAGVHCMAEAIGGLYDTPHGVANAIYLPVVVEYSFMACPEKYARIAQLLGEDVGCLPVHEAARRAAPALQRLCDDVGIPSAAEVGVRPEDFPRLAKAAAANVSVDSCPRVATEADFLQLFERAQRV